jgi:hypothetical protein
MTETRNYMQDKTSRQERKRNTKMIRLENNMFDFYSNLDDSLRGVVTGMTLMNEPAHSMPQDGNAMVRQTDIQKDTCFIIITCDVHAVQLPLRVDGRGPTVCDIERVCVRGYAEARYNRCQHNRSSAH